jgi:maltooligosyltrehalose trehalohydrolase
VSASGTGNRRPARAQQAASLPDRLGATYLGDGRTAFRVWAPQAQAVAVRLLSPRDERVPLAPAARGYFVGQLADVGPGALYKYVLDDARELPDPASRFQPQGVHGPSAVINATDYAWHDAGWCGIAQRDLVFYELHVGTFTPDGTFDAIVPHLDGLRELGVTAIELMPVAQFPGARNWGYDGAYPYAVQDSYGGPAGLQRLVDACHARGLAVFLDVVYNHLGPEGNYLAQYGPYFTDRYRTPWGLALNFDGPHSDEVRRYFVEQALYFLTAFHVDGFGPSPGRATGAARPGHRRERPERRPPRASAHRQRLRTGRAVERRLAPCAP